MIIRNILSFHIHLIWNVYNEVTLLWLWFYEYDKLPILFISFSTDSNFSDLVIAEYMYGMHNIEVMNITPRITRIFLFRISTYVNIIWCDQLQQRDNFMLQIRGNEKEIISIRSVIMIFSLLNRKLFAK